ncbi:MAG: PKD domain-containing protein, partial [Candidatus Thermoplasmatota archaeon]|nr:PKD domain-containing protein [Candidatus Thermoplasmatota archaeon]
VKKLVCTMTMGTKRKSLILSSLILLSFMLAGCVAFESTVNPRAVLQAYPLYIQEGETITLDARDSEAVEGVITDFKWNFGDGKTAETVIGFTSHTYAKFGIYTVTLTVENSGGGEDQVSVNIVVNGAPVLDLSIPENVKAGESALLDASASFDPEGKELLYSWDLDWSEDSNNDGDNRNDADAITPTVLLPTNKSGIKRGSLTISDGDGASQYTSFEVNISTRTFEVEWRTEQISLSWDGYLEQGASWEETINPGLEGRILSFEAVLELDQELGPQDNFTLQVEIFDDGYRKSAKTDGGNITANETAKAEMDRFGINPVGEDGTYTADFADDVLQQLLAKPGYRNGQGNWTWTIFAQQADPDPLFEGFPDPDPGNDWTLEVVIEIQVPVLTEIAV